jgi:hypothetical protein
MRPFKTQEARMRRMVVILLVLFGILAGVQSDTVPAAAQIPLADAAHHHDANSATASLPIAVDGSKTPERIPDELAYAHFLSVLAIKSAASPNEIGRRKAILAATGLANYDVDAAIKALQGVREQLDVLNSQRAQLTRDKVGDLNSRVLLASIRTQQETILRDAHNRVIGALSPDGIGILFDHVQRRVKPKITIYGHPQP